MNAPLLWSLVDFVLTKTLTTEKQSPNADRDRRSEAVWTQLEDRTFDSLRSLVFELMRYEVESRVVPVLQTATNLSNLDLRRQGDGIHHQTPVGPQFSSPSPLYPPLAWVSDQLGLSSPSELSPVDPGLRTLPSSCILSHIKYPESAFLETKVPVCQGISLSETVSQVPPRGNPDILQQFQGIRALTIRFELLSATISADKSTIGCWYSASLQSPQALFQTVQKVLEIVGPGVVVLSISAQEANLTAWTALTHLFWLFLSRSRGSLFVPTWHLGLSRETLAQDSSVTVLKRALTERGACGRRLKWIGVDDYTTNKHDGLMLEQFLGLVDSVTAI